MDAFQRGAREGKQKKKKRRGGEGEGEGESYLNIEAHLKIAFRVLNKGTGKKKEGGERKKKGV